MQLKIEDGIFDLFPGTVLGVAILHNIDNHGESEEITNLLREAETKAISGLGNIPLVEQLFISAWREAYRKFGAKPSDYPSSIENLIRRTLKGETVRHINKLVDIYNVISLRHLLPVGGEDLEKTEGDISLVIAGEDEPAIYLLGEKEPRAPHAGEVIYKDGAGAICRRWNWKEADRTKLTEKTKNAVLVIEGVPPISPESVMKATGDLAKLVGQYCGGDITTAILDTTNRRAKLL